MTALSEYQRLESTGLWRENAAAQRREVIVTFGDASLVILDTRSAVPLAHWSLPALIRRNPGQMPAIYAAAFGEAEGESLELADEALVAAIEKVHQLIEARKPHPGRLRGFLLGGGLLAVLALGIFWLPGEMVRQTAAVVPEAKRQEIGLAVLADITRISGAPCEAGQGPRALSRLGERLLEPGARIVVLPEALSGARQLPGKITAISDDLVEDFEAPEVAAGHIIAERVRARADDPLRALLRWAGFRATFSLLTTGNLSVEAIAGYGEALLLETPPRLPDAGLIAGFAAAGVSTAPYAYALDISGETVLGLIEADPFRAAPPTALLADGDWVALQGICGE